MLRHKSSPFETLALRSHYFFTFIPIRECVSHPFSFTSSFASFLSLSSPKKTRLSSATSLPFLSLLLLLHSSPLSLPHFFFSLIF
jgi:hypothetical protein